MSLKFQQKVYQEREIRAQRGKDRDPSTTFREPTIGKGLSGALQLLQHSGTLKDGEDLEGRSMDKKMSNLIEIAYHNNGGGKEKEISLERFYRILTPEESFRMLCYAFHGKGPGKRRVETRMKQEQKLKQMKDAPLLFVEKNAGSPSSAAISLPCACWRPCGISRAIKWFYH